MQKFKINKNTIIFIIILISITAITLLFNKVLEYKKSYKSQIELYEAITDTIQVYKTKDSLNVAKIQVMQTDKESDFLKIKNLTGTNLELQNLIKNKDKKIKDLNTALIHKDETVYIDTLRMYYPIGGDTIIFSQSVLLDTINNKWINAKYGFNKGLSYLDLKVYNEYQITIGYEGGNLFKKGTSYGIVTNMNPYTSPIDMRVYQVSVPPLKRFGIGVQSGFGGLYDIRNNNLGYGFYIGLGFSYNIIRW